MIVAPAATTELGDAVFNKARPGTGAAVTVTVDGSDATAGPVGGVPDATAVFTITPASTSACVVTYVLVQVVEVCGASVATGHVTTGGAPDPENAVSATPTPVNVALPVLTTAYE
ncbi:hypothetical protein [Streptosporangium sp. NPDC002721]|uniref:hypothetical protein n=1 Tax=Streptosporangium sp. NPDC002721 TaxID=3366188 RepID=UPI00367AE2E2